MYAFLSPVPMPAVWAKAIAEMRPGSLLVSNSFEVPGHEADAVIEVGDRRGTRLFLYRMRARGEAPKRLNWPREAALFRARPLARGADNPRHARTACKGLKRHG